MIVGNTERENQIPVRDSLMSCASPNKRALSVSGGNAGLLGY